MSMAHFGAGLFGPASGAFPAFDPRPHSRRVRSPHPSLEVVEYPITGQHLRDTGVGFAALADRGEEFAVLQLDAVHADVDLAHVDLLVLAGEEIIVARDVGCGVADVAEERAE